MTVYSPLRYRRFSKERAEKTYQFIGFQLRDRWFGLPIDAMEKATLMGKIASDPQNTGVRFTQYEGRQLLIIDVDRQIFARKSSTPLNAREGQFLAVIKHKNGDLLGLPIDSPPSVFRISESGFIPVPETYLEGANIQCITAIMAQVRDRQPLLLLDSDLLFQPAHISHAPLL